MAPGVMLTATPAGSGVAKTRDRYSGFIALSSYGKPYSVSASERWHNETSSDFSRYP
jgi:hypothetical protein